MDDILRRLLEHMIEGGVLLEPICKRVAEYAKEDTEIPGELVTEFALIAGSAVMDLACLATLALESSANTPGAIVESLLEDKEATP